MKLFQVVMLLTLLLNLTAATVFSQDVTLSWDPSPSSSVTGYKVYYKEGDPNPPFDGVAAANGVSPVDIGDRLSTDLTGLIDGETYYIVVTAYDAQGNESAFSNVVHSRWVPALLPPEKNSTNAPYQIMFEWEEAPVDLQVNYTLYYGTDRDQVANAELTPLPAPHGNLNAPMLPGLLLTAALLTLLLSRPRTAGWRLAPAVLLLGGLLTACGGGGGDSPLVTEEPALVTSNNNTPVATADFQSIDTGSDNYYDAYEVEPNTTYYWKVVATKTDNAWDVYESAVGQFTTDDF